MTVETPTARRGSRAMRSWGPHSIDVAILGARGHYAVPRILQDLGLLRRFYTDAYLGNKPRLRRFLNTFGRYSGGSLERFSARVGARLSSARVSSFDFLGLVYWAGRQALPDGAHDQWHAWANRVFAQRVLESADSPPAAIYGCNTAAAELFEAYSSLGTCCILEQISAPRRIELQLLAQEVKRWPGWQEIDLSCGYHLTDREEREWRAADRVLAPSELVRKQLINSGVAAEKCRVVPYGVDLRRFRPVDKRRRRSGDLLNVLFAGEVGLQKGAPYLLEALRLIGPRRLSVRLAGKVRLSGDKRDRYRDIADFCGPIPRSHMPRMYRWADVLVLPTVSEGFGLVHAEALASGVPVVTTPRCGSLVRDGIDGFIVPAGDVDALAARLDEYVRNPDCLQAHQLAARESRSRLGLHRYRESLLSGIRC